MKTLPGETPIRDTAGLKVAGITTRGELNVAEARNIRKVVIKYLSAKPSRRTAPFEFSWFLTLHKEMLGDVWSWAGIPRTDNVNLGSPWQRVEADLMQLVGDLAYWEQHWPDVLEQAVHLHHRAVEIHPFLNGNGRWARMLANIWLICHDHPVTTWPDEIVAVSKIRNEYLHALKTADRGNFGPLLNLTRQYTIRR